VRKKFAVITAIFMAFALVLSACSKGADTKGPDTKPPVVVKEASLNTAWAYDVPPKSHFNVFATGSLTFAGGMYADLMTSPLAMYYWSTDTWEKQLAEDWKVDNAAQTVTVSLRHGVKWSDGTELKAQDVLAYSYIGWGKAYAMWRYVDKVTAKDDYTVVYHLSNPSAIALRYILKSNPQPSSVYGEFAKQYKDLFDGGKLQTSDEVKALNKKFDELRPTDYVASGPFKMDTKSISEAQISLVKRPDAWNADKVKIDKIVIFNGETEAATPLVLDKQIDYVTHAFPPATEQQFSNLGLRIIRFPYYTGPAIFFNNDIYPFNVTEFRQAIAYAVDRGQAGTVALGKSGIGVDKMAGLADKMIDLWVPKDVAAKLNPYKLDLKKAEEILTKLNFKKGADGIWVDDKGKKLQYEFSVPSDFTDWSAAASNVADQLTKFGIKTTVRGTLWSQYTTDMNAGKFQFGFLPWGSSVPHPQFAFLADVFNYNGGGKAIPTKEKPGQNWPMKQKYSGGDIDFDALITESGKGLDTNKQKEAVGKLVLAFNELLPVIPIFERYSNAPILDGTRVTGWPADGDAIYANGSGDSLASILVVTGKLHGVTK
jgi:peptide/nickel transport system substrate-binding protein